MKKRAPENDVAEDSYKSRSRKKRESTALQQYGEKLAALSPAVWKQLPLSPDLEEALMVWRGLKTREAKRRHMQYIGRLMRELDDPEALTSALDDVQMQARGSAKQHTDLEMLRDAMLHEKEEIREKALAEALQAHPALERGQLAHLVEAALAEREKKRPPRQARALFRYLRDGMGKNGPE